MNKTRKQTLDETGYTPEDISEMARNSRAIVRQGVEHRVCRANCEDKCKCAHIGKTLSHEERVEFVYEGLKHQRHKMMNKGKDKKSKCWKCNGKGVLLHFGHIDNGLCYPCNGTGSALNTKPQCTGLDDCLHCESVRRKAYQTGAGYYG